MTKILSCTAMLCAIVLLSACAQPGKEAAVQNTAGNNDACLKEYTALKSLNPAEFDIYKHQFQKLNESYSVFKKEGDMMNKDSKEMLVMELNDKKTLICARVKSAVFKDITKRARMINDI
ncbi:hypothetical protein GE278_22715 (plasmid) [Enterobacteriaceae bacterium Kacie_13]|nr:hypothetical protein GE278_22715 [Enterobacteriaceae bacterium Kacie_13]